MGKVATSKVVSKSLIFIAKDPFSFIIINIKFIIFKNIFGKND